LQVPRPLVKRENRLADAEGFQGELTNSPFPLLHLGRLGVVGVAKILIFDEYPSIRNLLAEELAGEGNVILAVGRPELIGEGIPAFKPDLAILDLFLRGKFRWEFLGEIRRQEPALPVILYSGYYPGDDPHLNQVDGFILKSCVLDELKQCIRYVLGNPTLEASMSAG
jgi:DNA-binding response OmpR family regulator